MSDAFVLRAESLAAGYGGKTGIDAVAGVSFEVSEGEKIALVGPNGSGKTTLLRAIAGVIPYRGRLTVRVRDAMSARRGEAVERAELRPKEAAREIALLSQLSASWFPFTVEDAVALGRYARQKSGFAPSRTAADRAAIQDAMESCGVESLSGAPLSRLSGGQLQRVFLARAIAQDAHLLLLDEPTNHLDLRYQIEIVDLARANARSAIGVFHDLSLAARFADRLILLDGGTIARDGPTRQVIDSDEMNRAYGIDVAETLRALSQTR